MSRRPHPLALYGAATGALEPFAPALLKRRARRGKEDPARLPERMGHPGQPRPPGSLAWLHGVSVGESLSLLPLIEGLSARHPALNLLVTSGTTTSARLLAQRLPEGVLHQYAPVDLPGVAARFLGHWRPDLAVFVESELWPNLIAAAEAQGTRLALISARLSDSSVRNWARAPATARALLGAFDLLLAQDEHAAAGLDRLGGKVAGRLNLKLLGGALPVDAASLAAHRRGAAGRPILLAASTHPGDEEQVLQAFAALPIAERSPHLVIAPRHPERGAEVAAAARAHGFSVTQQGRGEPFSGEQVHVADLLGELGLWFRLAAACFMGGSWAPEIGGHNPLEPARLGCPSASGPATENWRGVYADMAALGAVRTVAGPEDLTAFWAEALRGSPALAVQADSAKRFSEQQAGALDVALDRLEALL